MKKQEVIKELNAKVERNEAIVELDEWSEGHKAGVAEALSDAIFVVKQLDEPEKVVVPQCVADWYEKHKVNLPYEIYGLCIDYYNNDYMGEFYNWFKANLNGAIETLVKMQLFGYEVKKEKLYQVEVPSNMDGCYYALVRAHNGEVVLGKYDNTMWKALDSTKLTEEEIRENFEWAWKANLAREVEE